MKQAVVVIPVYLKNPTPAERASFRQTLAMLQNHDIVIVTHNRCDLTVYEQLARETGKNYTTELFDNKYFQSVEGYNDLCFSPEFYQRFKDYEYMLICQLDAWVFSDQLDFWCNKGYDYIGAPIFHAYTPTQFTTKFLGIGNGGFSLRRISHCLKITTANKNIPFVIPSEMIRFYWNLGRYTQEFTASPLRRFLIIPTVLGKIFGIHNTLDFYNFKHINEDLIFGSWSNKSWGHHAHLPTYKEAIRFSFEVHPGKLYNENHGTLPFGCHAFLKWDYESFWVNHIKLDS